MADILTRAVGKSSVARTPIYTVPADGATTFIGLRVANNTKRLVTCTVYIAGTNVSGLDVPIASGGYAFLEGEKLVAIAGDEVAVVTPEDGDLDVYASFLEQTPDVVAAAETTTETTTA